MFVKSIMIPKHNCKTIRQDEALKDALDLLEDNQIDGLPVLDGDQYAGIITRYGIYENFFLSGKSKEEFLGGTLVKDIATHQEQYLQGNEIFEKTLLDLKDFPLLLFWAKTVNFWASLPASMFWLNFNLPSGRTNPVSGLRLPLWKRKGELPVWPKSPIISMNTSFPLLLLMKQTSWSAAS